ncbi:MAG: four helix bundle protein [Verrucomicrobia bacterium]|nr:four helix bundle protein [Verrucomicrobiota bacterium]
MNYQEWLATVPAEITADSLWKMEAYRLGLFLSDLAWHDATKLIQDKRTQDLSGQLFRSVGSISANLAEGYSRGTGRDRSRFYEYALGSAREARDWYYKARYVLTDTVTNHRTRLTTQLIRLLLAMIPQQRESVLKENSPEYRIPSSDRIDPGAPTAWMLEEMPMP